jgi:hypothetical protein
VDLADATVVDLEFGVIGTVEVEDLKGYCGISTYSAFMTCMRLIGGDSISDTGFRLRGVTGTGELLAMRDSGSGLESGGSGIATLVTGVFTGLMRVDVKGGGACVAAFISFAFCSKNVLKNALDSSGRNVLCGGCRACSFA